MVGSFCATVIRVMGKEAGSLSVFFFPMASGCVTNWKPQTDNVEIEVLCRTLQLIVLDVV